MLTIDRLKEKVNKWRIEFHINTSDYAVKRLCDSLEDEIVEIAKEAHQRGLEGKAF